MGWKSLAAHKKNTHPWGATLREPMTLFLGYLLQMAKQLKLLCGHNSSKKSMGVSLRYEVGWG